MREVGWWTTDDACDVRDYKIFVDYDREWS